MNVLKTHLEKMKYMGVLVHDSYYQSTRKHIKIMLMISRSRLLMKVPMWSFDFQVEIQKIIEEYEQNVTEGRKKARAAPTEKLKNDYLLMADRNKLIASSYRAVIDGLAWRKLCFDKGVIRILSQAQSPGGGVKAGRAAEIRQGRRMARRGADVLLHDATTYLMVGDLSIIGKKTKKPLLGEVKANKKGVITAKTVVEKMEKGQPYTKQQMKLLQAQTMIMEDSIYIGDDVHIVFQRFNQPVKTYLTRVERLVNKARRTGFSSGQLSPYLLVEVTDFNNKKLDIEAIEKRSAKDKKGVYMPFTNYDTLINKKHGTPVRGIVPYTVFPFSSKNIVDIMMGNLYVYVGVDINAIKAEYKNRGWTMHVIEEGDVKQYADADRYGGRDLFEDNTLEDQKILFIHDETNFRVLIGYEVLIYIGYQFYSIEAVLAPLETRKDEVIAGGKSIQEYSYAINEYERKFWR